MAPHPCECFNVDKYSPEYWELTMQVPILIIYHIKKKL